MKKSKNKNKYCLPKYDVGGLVTFGMDNMFGELNKKKKKKGDDNGFSLEDTLSRILPVTSVAGNSLYNAANPVDDYSDTKLSTLGMGLQGASLGGRLGGIYGLLGGAAIGSGIGLLGSKKRNIDREAMDQNLYNAYLANSVVEPSKMKKGGVTKANFENAGSYVSVPIMEDGNLIIPQMYGSVGNMSQGIPITHIQTEKGEKIISPDGSVFDVKANKSHKKMDSGEVTDILPQGFYVAGANNKQSISKKKADKVTMGNAPVAYSENQTDMTDEAKEIKFSDVFKKENHTPAELADIARNKFKVSGKKWDIFTNITNDENKVGRIPYLMNIIALTEKDKLGENNNEIPQAMKKGGMVKKVPKYTNGHMITYLDQFLDKDKIAKLKLLNQNQDYKYDDALNSPSNSLEDTYTQYNTNMQNFADKYKQKYADYFKYARAANAGANAIGALGSISQSSEVNPGVLTTQYANDMFGKVPNFVRESNKSESLAPIYSIARNQGNLALPTSTTMSRLAPMVSNAISTINNTNKSFALDDVSKDNEKYKFLQNITNNNLSKIAAANNRSIGMENYKTAQVAGFGGRALTGDATLAGKELGTEMGLERASLDQGFNSAAQLAAYKIQQQMMKKLGLIK